MRPRDWLSAFMAILPALMYFGALETAIAYGASHTVTAASSSMLIALGAAGSIASLAIAFTMPSTILIPLIALLASFAALLTGTFAAHDSWGGFTLVYGEFAAELTIFRVIADGHRPRFAV